MRNQSMRPWTVKETNTAMELKRDRIDSGEIAYRLGRTRWAVRAHLKRIAMTDEQRRDYDKKKKRPRHIPASGHVIEPRPFECPKALAERDLAVGRGPRDLTAAFCGDPLPGRSMLDRRMSG